MHITVSQGRVSVAAGELTFPWPLSSLSIVSTNFDGGHMNVDIARRTRSEMRKTSHKGFPHNL